MFNLDRLQEIIDSLKRHKLRTIATALAVWWGIFMLVLLLGVGNGLQNSFNRDFADDAINSIWIWGGQTTQNYKGFNIGRSIQFTNKDYESLNKKIDGIEYSAGRYNLARDYLTTYKEKSLPFEIRAVHPDFRYVVNTTIKQGRYINELDIQKARKVAIIGKIAKEELFGKTENVIGKYITINTIPVQIIGVFTDMGGKREMRRVYIPITTAQKSFTQGTPLHNLVVTVGEATLEESKIIGDNIFKELTAVHHIHPKDKQAIYIRNNFEEYQRFTLIFAGIKLFIWLVGIGSIIAGVVGVSNIMLIVVKDRTREIGIRKAIGATSSSIINTILCEAIFLTSIAGYIGLLMGFSLVYGINYLINSLELKLDFFYNPEVDFLSALYAILFLVVCGVLAGLLPAIQAVKINPVEAMKA